MSYRKAYPSSLHFNLQNQRLSVSYDSKAKYNPDLWSIKYLFDKSMGDIPTEVCIKGPVSRVMALRMYFLKYLFPYVQFHDVVSDKYVADAKEIIDNVGTKYVTYDSGDHLLDNRRTKDKLESWIEKELANNLSKYVPDFPAKVKVIRQFPANIYINHIAENSRATSKLWIDMVSINSVGELSPIELKVGGNIPLDLFAQGLNYGIYCHLFNKHIRSNWFNEHHRSGKDKIAIYYIGEEFHPALVGKYNEKGIISLLSGNELFSVVFVKIKVDKKQQCIIGKPEVIFDTRKQCNL